MTIYKKMSHPIRGVDYRHERSYIIDDEEWEKRKHKTSHKPSKTMEFIMKLDEEYRKSKKNNDSNDPKFLLKTDKIKIESLCYETYPARYKVQIGNNPIKLMCTPSIKKNIRRIKFNLY
jgi:hypothetical protein